MMSMEPTRIGITMPTVHEQLAIATSGELRGNMDPRFTDFDAEVSVARWALHAALPESDDAFVIRPLASDGLVDVDTPDARISSQSPFLQKVVASDAMVTNRRRVSLQLNTADCIPLVLAQPDRDILALIHLGWKGAALRLHDKTIDYMLTEYDFDPSRAVAYFGPSIQAKSYIGDSIHPMQQADSDWEPHITEREDGKFNTDSERCLRCKYPTKHNRYR
jgi:copper oxidase (laccase) domain-containing protein